MTQNAHDFLFFFFENYQWMTDDFQVLGGCALILLLIFTFVILLTSQPDPPTFCLSLENKLLWDDNKNMIEQKLTSHLDKINKRKRVQETAQETGNHSSQTQKSHKSTNLKAIIYMQMICRIKR